MHAFSLEECGEYGRAEQAARAALALSPLDARAQYVEFVGDGGYDHPEFWDPAGWQWLQSEGRRGPRYVEQIGVASGAVVQTRFGNAMRMLGHQPAMHMSWWEADAWCRWAGRRLPAEVEWEVAAHTASRRGFHISCIESTTSPIDSGVSSY